MRLLGPHLTFQGIYNLVIYLLVPLVKEIGKESSVVFW